jgi:hypothetical protein
MTRRTAIQLALTLLVLGSVLVPSALAGKGGHGPTKGGTSLAPALTMTSEYTYSSPNPAAPSWCLTEDDIDQRTFSGSLSGSYSTQFRLCDGSTDLSGGIYWTAGGEGIMSTLSVVGTLTDLTITAPDGTTHHAQLIGSSGSTSTYEVCYCPPFYLSTNTGTDPLAGGNWNVTLSGQISSATWTAMVEMAYPNYQQANCPTSEQNLL